MAKLLYVIPLDHVFYYIGFISLAMAHGVSDSTIHIYQCRPSMVNVSYLNVLIKPSGDLINLESSALCD